MKKIPLTIPYVGKEEIAAVKEVIESTWLTSGAKVLAFENLIANYIGAKHAICVNSCSAALQLSLEYLTDGGEVIIPAFTHPATANAVIRSTCQPVLVDINPDTFTIDPDKVKDAITSRTKAIVLVHLFGQPCDMKPLLEISEEHNIPLVEDAAGAFGAEYNHGKVGTFGAMTCFSFDTRKILTIGEGGAIVTDDDEAAKWLRSARNHGMNVETWNRHLDNSIKEISFPVLGANFKMSDIHAAIGIAQYHKLHYMLNNRETTAWRYNKTLAKMAKVSPPSLDLSTTCHTYQSYVVYVRGNRDTILEELKKHGIQATYSSRALFLEPCFSWIKISHKLLNTLKAFDSTIALPFYINMGRENVKYICDCLKEVLS